MISNKVDYMITFLAWPAGGRRAMRCMEGRTHQGRGGGTGSICIGGGQSFDRLRQVVQLTVLTSRSDKVNRVAMARGYCSISQPLPEFLSSYSTFFHAQKVTSY